MAKTKPVSSETRSFLKKSQCGFTNRVPYVCCAENVQPISLPLPAPQNPLPDWYYKLKSKLPQSPHCGRDDQDRIFGGTETDLDEFGWIVLLEYKKCKYDKDCHEA